MYIFSNIGFEGRILNLIVQVSGHCLSFTFSFLFFECFTLEDHMLDKCQLNMLSLIDKDFVIIIIIIIIIIILLLKQSGLQFIYFGMSGTNDI